MPEQMMHAPNEQQIRCLLDDLLKRGDRMRMANIFQVTEQAVSQRFSRNSEGPCHLYQGLFDAWAICGANPVTGAELREFVVSQFDLWLGSTTSGASGDLAGDVVRETADVVIAELEKQPAHKRLTEALEAQTKLTEYIKSLQPALREAGR
jgi:hypothetical protein